MAEKWQARLSYQSDQGSREGGKGEGEKGESGRVQQQEPEAAQASELCEKKGWMVMRLVTLASGLTGREATSYGGSWTGLAVVMHGMGTGEIRS